VRLCASVCVCVRLCVYAHTYVHTHTHTHTEGVYAEREFVKGLGIASRIQGRVYA
jgi:hypothetical protein